MRAPVFSVLLLLLLPLSITFFSSKAEAAESQKDDKLPAERHPKGTTQECLCKDIFQNTHGGKRVRVSKSPTRHCPCDRLKHKRKKSRHQKRWRQSCLRFLKQCQLQKMAGPL
ncbi:C-X-C motif chemokine 17 [Notamacropus eugenii]|uniref:C-X-C motif chemokine 17 n=1 Tax=Notamacropus eugenii TaxID=9315 RepID=UPI003B67C133